MKIRILALVVLLAGCGSAPSQTRTTICGAARAACALVNAYCEGDRAR